MFLLDDRPSLFPEIVFVVLLNPMHHQQSLRVAGGTRAHNSLCFPSREEVARQLHGGVAAFISHVLPPISVPLAGFGVKAKWAKLAIL